MNDIAAACCCRGTHAQLTNSSGGTSASASATFNFLRSREFSFFLCCTPFEGASDAWTVAADAWCALSAEGSGPSLPRASCLRFLLALLEVEGASSASCLPDGVPSGFDFFIMPERSPYRSCKEQVGLQSRWEFLRAERLDGCTVINSTQIIPIDTKSGRGAPIIERDYDFALC